MNWLKDNIFIILILLCALFALLMSALIWSDRANAEPDFSPLPPDYNECRIRDDLGWINIIADAEPDFSPPKPPVLGGPSVIDDCNYVKYVLEIITRGSHAIMVNGTYDNAGYIDISEADYGFAAVGEYREGGIFTNGAIVLRGSPKVKLWFDADCGCIRSSHPIQW